MERTTKQNCPTCGQSINEREIGIFYSMVTALFQVWRWSEDKKIHEFTRKDIKHLFDNENVTARFGDWIMFGGLVYRPTGEKKKGKYGLNIERVKNFFNGELAIPTVIYKNPLTKELTPDRYKTINKIPHLSEFLDEAGEYRAWYRGRVESGDIQSPLNFDQEEKKEPEKKKSKVKNPCSKCGTPMRLNMKVEYQGNVAKVVKKNLKCPKCGEEDFIL